MPACLWVGFLFPTWRSPLQCHRAQPRTRSTSQAANRANTVAVPWLHHVLFGCQQPADTSGRFNEPPQANHAHRLDTPGRPVCRPKSQKHGRNTADAHLQARRPRTLPTAARLAWAQARAARRPPAPAPAPAASSATAGGAWVRLWGLRGACCMRAVGGCARAWHATRAAVHVLLIERGHCMHVLHGARHMHALVTWPSLHGSGL